MQKLYLLFTVIFIYGCSTTISDFDKYQKAPLISSEFMPNKTDLAKKIPSVVIFDFTTEDENAKKISATKITEDYIAEVLVSGKLVNLQDRKNLIKLQDEIRLSEVSGNTSSTGIQPVDFAIDGNIASVTFDSHFKPAIIDPRNGNVILRDRYTYTATVQGAVKIYEIPSLKVLDTIIFSGSADKTEASNGVQVWQIKIPDKAKAFDQGLVKQAVKNGLARNSYKIKSFFAKTGYIMEKRMLDNHVIFAISLGANDGIKQEDKVEIYQKYSELNSLTGAEDTSKRLLTTGTVADKTEGDKTWIVVKDKTAANKIKLGDMATIIYQKGSFISNMRNAE